MLPGCRGGGGEVAEVHAQSFLVCVSTPPSSFVGRVVLGHEARADGETRSDRHRHPHIAPKTGALAGRAFMKEGAAQRRRTTGVAGTKSLNDARWQLTTVTRFYHFLCFESFVRRVLVRFFPWPFVAGPVFFAQGEHEKLTSTKPRGSYAKNRRKTPFFCFKKRFLR